MAYYLINARFPQALFCAPARLAARRECLLVYEKQGHAVVDGEVASGKQLAVALVIGEGERGRAEDSQESRLTATMLNVWPARFADQNRGEANDQPLAVDPDYLTLCWLLTDDSPERVIPAAGVRREMPDHQSMGNLYLWHGCNVSGCMASHSQKGCC